MTASGSDTQSGLLLSATVGSVSPSMVFWGALVAWELVWARPSWPPTLAVSGSVVLNLGWTLESQQVEGERGHGHLQSHMTSTIIQGPMLRRGLHAGGLMPCGCHLKFLIILFLNLCFVSKVQWDSRECTGGLEAQFTYGSTPPLPPHIFRMGSWLPLPSFQVPESPLPFRTRIHVHPSPAGASMWGGSSQVHAPCSPSRWGMAVTILALGSQHQAHSVGVNLLPIPDPGT